jgi:hypothetical protein
MLGHEPSMLRCGHGIARIAIGPDLVTQSHPDLPVPLLLNGRDVLTVFPVAPIAAAYFESRRVSSHGPEDAKRPARKLFDVVNAILRECDDPLHDQVAKRVVDRATNRPSDLLERRIHVGSERG